MTLEEKIAHLQTSSMEQARAEGNVIIDAHKEALEKVFEDHRAEALRQSETRIKAETTNARLSLNQAAAKSQLEIKRRQGKVQQELKDKIFEEVMGLVDDYMKTAAYGDFLVKCIRQAVDFAGQDPVTIYINPSDEAKRPGERHRRSSHGQRGRFHRRRARCDPQPQHPDRQFIPDAAAQ